MATAGALSQSQGLALFQPRTSNGLAKADSSRFSLPPEIVGIVTDHLSDDKSALRRLSTVSRIWRYPSQSHLFHTFAVLACHSDCSKKLEHFLAELAPRPGVGAFVRKLTIEWIPVVGEQNQYQNARGFQFPHLGCLTRREPHVNLTLLFSVLQELPALHTLVLRSCMLQLENDNGNGLEMRKGTLLPITAWAPSLLRKLVLAGVRGTLASFDALLQHLPACQALQVLDCSVSDDPQPPLTNPCRELTGLRELVVDLKYYAVRSHGTGLFYKALLEVPNRLTLLDVGSVFSNENMLFEEMRDLIHDRGQSLTHLRLDLCRENYASGDGGRARLLQTLNLTEHCPSLEVLHLTINAFCTTPSLRHCEANISQFEDATLLISTSPPSLHTIVVALWKRTIQDQLGAMKAVDLGRMDRALLRLKGLRSVLFQGATPYPILPPMTERPQSLPAYLQEFINQSLPLSHSREIIQFV